MELVVASLTQPLKSRLRRTSLGFYTSFLNCSYGSSWLEPVPLERWLPVSAERLGKRNHALAEIIQDYLHTKIWWPLLKLFSFSFAMANILTEENLGERGSIKLPIPNHAPLRGERQERNLKQLSSPQS